MFNTGFLLDEYWYYWYSYAFVISFNPLNPEPKILLFLIEACEINFSSLMLSEKCASIDTHAWRHISVGPAPSFYKQCMFSFLQGSLLPVAVVCDLFLFCVASNVVSKNTIKSIQNFIKNVFKLHWWGERKVRPAMRSHTHSVSLLFSIGERKNKLPARLWTDI